MNESTVRETLTNSFERVDREYYHLVREAHRIGFGAETRAGSCAVVSVVMDGWVFVANAGDCRCVMGVNKKQYQALNEEVRQRYEDIVVQEDDEDLDEAVSEGEPCMDVFLFDILFSYLNCSMYTCINHMKNYILFEVKLTHSIIHYTTLSYIYTPYLTHTHPTFHIQPTNLNQIRSSNPTT